MNDTSWENAPREVEIPDFYIWRAPISAISLPPVPMYSKLKVHTWTGYQEENGAVQEEKMVYISGYRQSLSFKKYMQLSQSILGSSLSKRTAWTEE